MIKVYTDQDFNAVYEQKRKVFWVFMGVTVAYLVLVIACLVYHTSLPYGDALDNVPKAIVYVATALYVIFAFPFMAIKYHRLRKYYKMLYYVSEGIKNDEQNYFVGFEKCDLQKDNVDVISCIFLTYNKKKQEWMKREAYLDVEKPLPKFERGDLVRYITQSNFIIQYDILQKKAVEIEELSGEYEPYEDYEYGEEAEVPQEGVDEITSTEEITNEGEIQ